MINPVSNATTDLLVNGRWVMEFWVLDDNGNTPASEPTIVVTSTNPNGDTSTPTAELVCAGLYRAAVEVDVAGRWIVTVEASGYGSTSFSAYVSDVTASDAFPDLADVKAYLGTVSASDATIQDALDAESSTQRRVCEVPAVYPSDLAQALKRRVARNLAMRGLPIAVLQGDSQSGDLVLPGRDPEVRRLEAAHRKLVQPSWS